ncbi:biopolymer transporter ExbD [uncultured Marinobacter sp.]|uniref:ExbD/TolR family protein n=1 Tax=uncultured Marinobacter sp. TaxID=187379 RepID=UPI0026212431|nr:biopolymer transporter ExbD [uncultured Marinobacter sp.]MDX1598924.1 biopolymer transporter ExbD [Marinobacter sp.]
MNDLVPPPSTSGKTLMERVEDALLPLINLVFLLLMFFIVAGQLADTPLPDLPAAARAESRQPPHADLMISADRGWHINGETVSREALPTRLPAPDETTPLKIAAGEDVSMSDLEDLLRLLEDNGYTEVILLTEPMQ